jgi:hypothetical protein
MKIETNKYMPKDMIEYLKHWLSADDFKIISSKHGYSIEMARLICSGTRKILERNLAMVHDLMSKAAINRNQHIEKTKRAHREAAKLI